MYIKNSILDFKDKDKKDNKVKDLKKTDKNPNIIDIENMQFNRQVKGEEDPPT